jgi:hypothetical protein
MAGLASARLMFNRRNLLVLFPAKGRCLTGQLPLGFFQFITRLTILLLALLDWLFQAFDFGSQFLL